MHVVSLLHMAVDTSTVLGQAFDLPSWMDQTRPWDRLQRVSPTHQEEWRAHANAVLDKSCQCYRGGDSLSSGRRMRRAVCERQNHTVECEGFQALRELFWESTGGISIELGSMDGYFASEGVILEQAANFKRILIEADPTWRSARRRFSTNAVGVTAAICATQSKVHFLQRVNANKQAVTSGTQGIVEFMDTVYLQKWFPELHRHLAMTPRRDWAALDWTALATTLASFSTTEVSCQPLSSIFDALGVSRVDLFILDTEGAEIDILRSIDFSRVRFNMLIVEAYSPTGSRAPSYAQKVINLMLQRGGDQYEVMFRKRGRNIWFRHRSFSPRSVLSLPNGCGNGPQHPSQQGAEQAAHCQATVMLPHGEPLHGRAQNHTRQRRPHR